MFPELEKTDEPVVSTSYANVGATIEGNGWADANPKLSRGIVCPLFDINMSAFVHIYQFVHSIAFVVLRSGLYFKFLSKCKYLASCWCHSLFLLYSLKGYI